MVEPTPPAERPADPPAGDAAALPPASADSAPRLERPTRAPRIWSPRKLRWMLTLFPPFLLQRIRVEHVAPDFRSCRVRLRRSFLTRNLHAATFGGSIYAAGDPVHAVLLWQLFAHEGLRVAAAVKSARVSFLRRAEGDLVYDCVLSEEDVAAARADLTRGGRFARTFRTRALDAAGETCALVETEVVLKLAGSRSTRPAPGEHGCAEP